MNPHDRKYLEVLGAAFDRADQNALTSTLAAHMIADSLRRCGFDMQQLINVQAELAVVRQALFKATQELDALRRANNAGFVWPNRPGIGPQREVP